MKLIRLLSVTSPEVGMKIKRQNKAAVEAELAKAMERLEIEESTADQLKKSHLTLRRAMQKVSFHSFCGTLLSLQFDSMKLETDYTFFF